MWLRCDATAMRLQLSAMKHILLRPFARPMGQVLHSRTGFVRLALERGQYTAHSKCAAQPPYRVINVPTPRRCCPVSMSRCVAALRATLFLQHQSSLLSALGVC